MKGYRIDLDFVEVVKHVPDMDGIEKTAKTDDFFELAGLWKDSDKTEAE